MADAVGPRPTASSYGVPPNAFAGKHVVPQIFPSPIVTPDARQADKPASPSRLPPPVPKKVLSTDKDVLQRVLSAAEDSLKEDAFKEVYNDLVSHFSRWQQLESPKGDYLSTLQPTERAKLFVAFGKMSKAWAVQSERENQPNNPLKTFAGQIAEGFVECLNRVNSWTPELRKEFSKTLGESVVNWKKAVKAEVQKASAEADHRAMERERRVTALALKMNREEARAARAAARLATHPTTQKEALDAAAEAIKDEEEARLDALLPNAETKGQRNQADKDAADELMNREQVAESRVPFLGALHPNMVAKLFVATQNASGPLGVDSDEFRSMVDRHFAESYQKIDLDSHHFLMDARAQLPEAGQVILGAAVAKLGGLQSRKDNKALGEAFEKLFSGVSLRSPAEIAAGLDVIRKYRRSLDLPQSDEHLLAWLSNQLGTVFNAKLSEISEACLLKGNAVHAAWSDPNSSDKKIQDVKIIGTAVRTVLQAEWLNREASYFAKSVFPQKPQAWSPALQEHFKQLIKKLPRQSDAQRAGLDVRLCIKNLEILSTYQEVAGKKSMFQWQVTRTIAAMKKLDPILFQKIDQSDIDDLDDLKPSERPAELCRLLTPGCIKATTPLLDQVTASYVAQKTGS